MPVSMFVLELELTSLVTEYPSDEELDPSLQDTMAASWTDSGNELGSRRWSRAEKGAGAAEYPRQL